MKYRYLARLDANTFCIPLTTLLLACVIPISSAQPGGGTGSDTNGMSSDGGLAGIGSAEGASVQEDGAPIMGVWKNVTGNLANMDSECGNMMYVTAKPDEDLLIAGIALHGLWSSRDGGASWTPIGTGTGSDRIDHRPNDIVFDPIHSNQWWESGIHGTLGGVYVTGDDGNTFTQLGTVQSNDEVSVDFSDPDRRTLLAGAHETPQTLYKSVDQGKTWQNIGGGLPAGIQCPSPYVIDAQTYLVGCGGTQNGIYRSTNGGTTWTSVANSGGSFAQLRASDQSIYWASPDGTLTRSVDNGQTWHDQIGSGKLTWDQPIELPDGRLATIAQNSVVVSVDHGTNWREVTTQLQMVDGYGWFGLAYSQQRKAFFTWHWTCGNGEVSVPTDAIMRFDFDWKTQ